MRRRNASTWPDSISGKPTPAPGVVGFGGPC